MGIGPKKTWDAISTSAYEMDLDTGKWKEKRPVPGVAGRLAASAVALHDQVFIFGGYVIDSTGRGDYRARPECLCAGRESVLSRQRYSRAGR